MVTSSHRTVGDKHKVHKYNKHYSNICISQQRFLYKVLYSTKSSLIRQTIFTSLAETGFCAKKYALIL